jgi:segregation and condensation protein A
MSLFVAEGIRIPVPPGVELVQPYPVKLPTFEGPLDLLFHLVRKNEVDLKNIPVAEICRQYHEYIVLMQELDLEVAAEFLYMEALLVQIKSQLVLPRPALADGAPGEDPRDELVRRLLEYRKFKGVAETLHEMEAQRLGLWARPPVRLGEPGEEDEVDLTEVSLFDLMTLFRGVLDRYRAEHPPTMEIEHQKYSIREKMEQMLARLRATTRPAPLTEVFASLSGRAEAIAVFLAVLELLRLGVVRALQAGEFAEIYLESTGESLSLDGYQEVYR